MSEWQNNALQKHPIELQFRIDQSAISNCIRCHLHFPAQTHPHTNRISSVPNKNIKIQQHGTYVLFYRKEDSKKDEKRIKRNKTPISGVCPFTWIIPQYLSSNYPISVLKKAQYSNNQCPKIPAIFPGSVFNSISVCK